MSRRSATRTGRTAPHRGRVVTVLAALVVIAGLNLRADEPLARAVTTVGFTVSDADRAEAFFRDVLTFRTTSDREVMGPVL